MDFFPFGRPGYFYQLQIIIARGANCKNHFLVSERRGNFHNVKYYRVGEFGWRWMGWECSGEGCRPRRKRHPQKKKNALHFQSPMHFLQSLCVPAAREEKFLALPSSKKSPFLTRDPLLEPLRRALTLSFWWKKNFLPEISTPLRLILCDSAHSGVCVLFHVT